MSEYPKLETETPIAAPAGINTTNEGGDNENAPPAELFIKDTSERSVNCCKVLQPGKNYRSLGPGQTCEIANCGRQAYHICNPFSSGMQCCTIGNNK